MKRKLYTMAMGFILLVAPVFTGCIKEEEPVTPVRMANMTEAVTATPNFKILATAVTKANLTADLRSAGPLTLFAPTNRAFINFLGVQNAADPEAAAVAAINRLDAAVVANILKYHTVNGRLKSNTLTAGTVTTLNGATLTIQLSNGVKVVGTGNEGQAASVTAPDVEVSNGLIHVIDRVLLPN